MKHIPWISALIVLVICTLAIAIPLDRWNAKMRDLSDFAFPDLQNAKSEPKARQILDAWKDPDLRTEIARTMKLDLVFPLFYAPLIALIAFRASRNARHRWVATLGAVLAAGALAAGVFDLLENMTMLRMLADDDATRWRLVQAFGMPKNYLSQAATIYALLAHFDA